MIYVNEKKYACETCIKGHRSSSCQHTDRALFEIKKKGRPVTQCDHCRELRKTKQVHVRCSCDSKPDGVPMPKVPGKKGSRLPAEPAYPHGLSPSLSGVATSPAPSKSSQTLNQTAMTEVKCTCGDGQNCHCCVPRKTKSHAHSHSHSSSGHTPPPGHDPSNPHPHHAQHAHAYAPYTRPVRLSTDQLPQSHAQVQTMYRLGACACGTACQCPECAQHRRLPHTHSSNPAHTSPNQPFQGHGGDPCPIRCGNCFDCAGGLTLLLDPAQASAHPLESESTQFSSSNNGSYTYSNQALTATNPRLHQNGNGYNHSPNSTPNGSGYFTQGTTAADVEMDEFNAAMAGLDAGIAAEANGSPGPACSCPAGQCTCPGHQHGDGNRYWDRPRCGFAVSTERGGCCPSPGMHDMVSEVGSDIGIGVGSDGGFGVGSDGGIGSDAGSVAGVGSTNLSMDFADLDFGTLGIPPMAYDQRLSGEYVYAEGVYRDSGHFSHPRDSGQFSHHRDSSQFSNHSNLSLPSSIDSASISLASLASSHGISSLASSHGIPSLASSHGVITPHSSPLSGRVTPNRGLSGRITPVRGMGPNGLGQMQNGKPVRAYRRILPKVAATVSNHRPFRRHHTQQQPSLHAVMEGDVNQAIGTTPPPSQVLLQPGQQRIRPSVRSHLPIVGKYFAPGARFEPSRFRNAAAAAAAAQAQLQAQQAAQARARQQQLHLQAGMTPQEAAAYEEASYAASLDGSYDGSYASSQAPGSPYSQGFSPQEQPLGSFAEEEEDLMYQEEEQARLEAQNGYGFQEAVGQFGGAEPGVGAVYLQQQQQMHEQDARLQAQAQAQAQAQDIRLQAQVQDVRLQAQVQMQQQTQSQHSSPTHTVHPSPVSATLPVHAQMVSGFAHAPAPYIPAATSYGQLPTDQRPQLPLQHSSSTATGIIVDASMHNPDPTPAPPSPKKVSSGIPMQHTMSLPLSRTTFNEQVSPMHAYDDADVKPEGGIKELPMQGGGQGGGQGGPGKKSRWPSFSVHGHRVMVGAKVMGAAYAQRG
ncbi:unnamed protein product [Rhizoctonia solani]|uniref:Copper-fist domain-containing protein n=1 Tax=Rhizoctonia solani TaxID=456999 RepID=A0A8H3C7E6_9AGAM|nr:unnamed protein product [Rhizoctonia solani]